VSIYRDDDRRTFRRVQTMQAFRPPKKLPPPEIFLSAGTIDDYIQNPNQTHSNGEESRSPLQFLHITVTGPTATGRLRKFKVPPFKHNSHTSRLD
jgi:hypothetical protein